MLTPNSIIAASDRQIPELDFAGVSALLRTLLRDRFPWRSEPVYHSLQEVLYEVRQRARFQITELAARLGVAPSTICSIENGSQKFRAATTERLAKIAGYYAMPRAEEFLTRLAASERYLSYKRGGKR